MRKSIHLLLFVVCFGLTDLMAQTFSACYADKWIFAVENGKMQQKPQLINFKDDQYCIYDLSTKSTLQNGSIKERFRGTNNAEFPFDKIDAVYVDEWGLQSANRPVEDISKEIAGLKPPLFQRFLDKVSKSRQLKEIVFISGHEMVRYNMGNRTLSQTSLISQRFKDFPFSWVSAVITEPGIYDFPTICFISDDRCCFYKPNGETIDGKPVTTYALSEKFSSLPFETIDAAYNDNWTYPGRSYSYIFSGKEYCMYRPGDNISRNNIESVYGKSCFDKDRGIQVNPVTNNDPEGHYFALIIGVADYDENKLDLDQPLKDAKSMKEVLTKNYNFLDENCQLVENPTRQGIISALVSLRKKLGDADNLLIFYAGHGYWDSVVQQGYWWPRDANMEDPSNWISNSDLVDHIKSIRTQHTLLISDACFSGGIFKSRDGSNLVNAPRAIKELYQMKSRRAITSGTLTTVPDKSVFMSYLLQRLAENQKSYLSSQELFSSIRELVINNAPGKQVPQDGVIRETGDELGDFIFIRKVN